MKTKTKASAALVFWLATVLSAQSADISGKYEGLVLVDGLPQPVFFDVKNASPGGQYNNMQFSRPRNCTIFWEFGGEVDGEYFFYDHGSDGGWCDKFENGKQAVLKLIPVNGREVKVELSSGQKVEQSISLSRK